MNVNVEVKTRKTFIQWNAGCVKKEIVTLLGLSLVISPPNHGEWISIMAHRAYY